MTNSELMANTLSDESADRGFVDGANSSPGGLLYSYKICVFNVINRLYNLFIRLLYNID